MALNLLPSLFEDEHKVDEMVKAKDERRVQELSSEVGRLTAHFGSIFRN
jgi:hypothetical protein